MKKQFYIGQVVEPEDLFFRESFIKELWESLENQHVILTAPRRTGKTSVMTHLLQRHEDDWLVLYLNVQATSSPVDFYLLLLDEFNTRDPKSLRRIFEKGASYVKGALQHIDSVEVGSLEVCSLKVGIRDQDKDLEGAWKERLNDLLDRIRDSECRILVILDELPDMLLAMKKDVGLLREFLAWFRIQRTTRKVAQDRIRWLIGGSINLIGTLDSMGMVDLMNDPQVMPLPVFSHEQVVEFVTVMLESRGCAFDEDVPDDLSRKLGRPIPYFLQMATQDLFRKWRSEPDRSVSRNDVADVFRKLIASPEARDKLQHYYSRIDHYYGEAREPAYALLRMLSLSDSSVPRQLLRQKYDEVQHAADIHLKRHEGDRAFNEMMLHLENDFYIVEAGGGNQYVFASGLLKAWWGKYYA